MHSLHTSEGSSSWGQPHDRPTPWDKQTVPALNLLEGRFGVPFPIFGPSLVGALVPAVRRADVVHIHDVFYLSSLVAGVAATALNKPLVLTQHVDMIPHTSRLVESAQRTVFRTYGRFLFSRSSQVLVLNDRVHEFVARGGASPDRIQFLPNGVDVGAFRPAIADEKEHLRVGLGLPLDRVLVLFAGRPVPKKGFDLFVESAGPDYDLLFVGGERRPMEVRHNGGHLYSLGSVSRVEMAEIYRAADVFCLPSVGEGFPLTVQEAMASGLPVVTTADEAYRRYQVPADAACFVRRDAAEISWELGRLASSAVTRAEIGRRAREYVETHFSWDVHARRLTEVYREAQVNPVHLRGGRRRSAGRRITPGGGSRGAPGINLLIDDAGPWRRDPPNAPRPDPMIGPRRFRDRHEPGQPWPRRQR
jgi:D-inositol-3-phosphate glycosyltransferase